MALPGRWLLAACLVAPLFIGHRAGGTETAGRPAAARQTASPPAPPRVPPPTAQATSDTDERGARADRRIADYQISVTLDPDTKRLSGLQRVTWRNPSTETVPELWFHLYLNAFRNTQSTFVRESGGHLRGDDMPENGFGWIDITSITIADPAVTTPIELADHLTFEAPDDGNRDDRTVARLPLPRAVGPGGSIALDITFTVQLPKIFARSGYVRDYFLVGQWFPKLAVYEPAGLRGRAAGGWNAHQYHALTEFYADFGHYRVDITVPARFRVGATGTRLARRDTANGLTTYTYDQADVHDFAWTASPDFVEVTRSFVAAREVTAADYAAMARRLDRPIDRLQLSDVQVTFLMQPEHLPQLERHVRATMLALKWFGLWFGRYPYRTLTIVDPAYGGEGSGGMEYPTFVTAGTRAWMNHWPFDGVREAEITVVHEIAHQFWQGLVANNEVEEPWLDEGLASYAAGRAMEIGYGRDATLLDLFGLRLSERDYLRTAYTPNAQFHAIRQLPWTYASDNSYAFNAYVRPELLLRTLEHYAGAETVARIMRTFAERWRYRHPSTDDFYAVAQEVSGRDLRPLLAAVIDHGQVMDYEVDDATSHRAAAPAGWFDDPRRGRRFVDQEAAEAARDAEAHPAYDSRVVVRRRGELIAPIDIQFTFDGKPPERVTWDGAARTRIFTFSRPERLLAVDIDPDRRVELDVDWLNNSYRLEPDTRAAVYLESRWTFLLQQMLMVLGL